MNYKNTTKVLIATLVLSLVLPIASLATTTPRGNGERAKEVKAKAGANICTNLVTKLEGQNQKLGERLGNFEVKKGEQFKRISENRLNVDERRLGVRSQVDENREARFSKLEARATTTEQKAAVATFRSTLKTITEARRLAVDNAVKSYRASVDQTLTSRKTAVETARKTLQSAIDAALVKAKADCGNNVDNQTIRKAVNDSVKAARLQFATTVKGLDKNSDVVKAATEARKAAVTKAQTDFKTAYDKALNDLKLAFQK